MHPLIAVSPFSHQLIMQLIKGTSAGKHGASWHSEKVLILSSAMTWEVTIITQLTILSHIFAISFGSEVKEIYSSNAESVHPE